MKISKEFKIGFISVVTIALCIWGFNFLKGINILKNTRTYYVVYEKVGGILESAPVMIKGFQVGLVDNISFINDKSYDILVKLEIHKEYNIPKNSVARIYSSDIMGSRAIDLILSESLVFHSEFDTLKADIEGDLAEQVSIQMLPLKTKAEDLMKEMMEALEVIRYIFNEENLDNLSKSFESIKFTINNLESTSYTLDTLVSSQRIKLSEIFSNIESISKNLRNNNETITNIINNFSAISDSLAQSDIKSTIYNTNKVLSHTDEILKKINSGEGSLGLLLNNDSLYNNLEATSRDLDELIKDINSNPKKYVHFSIFGSGKSSKKEKEKTENKEK